MSTQTALFPISEVPYSWTAAHRRTARWPSHRGTPVVQQPKLSAEEVVIQDGPDTLTLTQSIDARWRIATSKFSAPLSLSLFNSLFNTAATYRDSEDTWWLLRPLWIPGGVGYLNTVEAGVEVLRRLRPDFRIASATPRMVWLADLASRLWDLDRHTRAFNDEVARVKHPSKSVRVARAAAWVRYCRDRLHDHGLTDEQIDLALRLSDNYEIHREIEDLWSGVEAITAS